MYKYHQPKTDSLPAPTSEAIVSSIAVRVILVRAVAANVVLIVHVLGVLLGVLVGLDLVDLVQALGLGKLVDLGAGESGEDFLGGGVAHGFAWRDALC